MFRLNPWRSPEGLNTVQTQPNPTEPILHGPHRPRLIFHHLGQSPTCGTSSESHSHIQITLSPVLRLPSHRLLSLSLSHAPQKPLKTLTFFSLLCNNGCSFSCKLQSFDSLQGSLLVFNLFHLSLQRRFRIDRCSFQALSLVSPQFPPNHRMRTQERSWEHKERSGFDWEEARRQDLRRSGRQARRHHRTPARDHGEAIFLGIPVCFHGIGFLGIHPFFINYRIITITNKTRIQSYEKKKKINDVY